MKKYYLGRIPSKLDTRDYNLDDFIPKGIKKLSLLREKKWDFPSDPLNQKSTNHCVGFSMAGFGINLPTHTHYTDKDGHDFYYACKEVEGRPKDEDGAMIRSAAKVLKNKQKIKGYAFAYTVPMIKWWLLNRGPMIAGTIWTEGMFTPDNNFRIYPTGEVVGGHAYLLNEWTKDNYIGFQNSWGAWGNNGKAYISSSDFLKIFVIGGEVVASVEVSNSKESCCTN